MARKPQRPQRQPHKTRTTRRRVAGGAEEGRFRETSSSWRKQRPFCWFLIYEVLLSKIPSANSHLCDTGLPLFLLVFESEPLSRG